MNASQQPHTTPQLMAEINAGDAALPSDLARHAPPGRSGKRGVDPRTIVRWMLDGIDGPRGRVRLEAATVSGRLVSTRAALARFVNAQQLVPGATPPRNTPGGVSEALDDAGI